MGVENISFILFASEESKIHFEIPSTIGNARSKKFSNCTTTRLRWNSHKFLGTISYEISWSTNKTKFYTRKISIFSVDLFTEWGTRAISGQTAGLEVSEVWRCTLAHRKRVDNSSSCSSKTWRPPPRCASSRPAVRPISSSWMISPATGSQLARMLNKNH